MKSTPVSQRRRGVGGLKHVEINGDVRFVRRVDEVVVERLCHILVDLHELWVKNITVIAQQVGQ